MAASANPSGNNQEGSSNQKGQAPPPTGAAANGIPVNSTNSGGNSGVADTQSALRHNPGVSVDWSPEEQSLLEELLVKYLSFCFNLFGLVLSVSGCSSFGLLDLS